MKLEQAIFSFIILLTSNLVTGQDICYVKVRDIPTDRDFKELWTHKSFEGTIGNLNQRIQIRFIQVTKDEKAIGTYSIKGKSKVNNNICDFSGHLTIQEVFELDNSNDNCEGPTYASGLVKGTYEFREDVKQNHVGVFKGEFVTYWETEKNQILSYDGWYTAEGTNEFIGTWTEYNSQQSKYSSWGIQVPPSKDKNLFQPYDNEFYIFNNKFIDKGWKTYVYANLNSWITIPKVFHTDKDRFLDDFIQIEKSEILKARDIEKLEWWK
jgi:hypothetical protein